MILKHLRSVFHIGKFLVNDVIYVKDNGIGISEVDYENSSIPLERKLLVYQVEGTRYMLLNFLDSIGRNISVSLS